MASRVGVNLNPQGLQKASLPEDIGSRFTSEHGEPLRLPSGTIWAKGAFVVVWGLGTTGLAPVGRKALLHLMSGAKPRFVFLFLSCHFSPSLMMDTSFPQVSDPCPHH